VSRRRLALPGFRSVLWGLLGAASIAGIAVAEPLSFDVAEAWLGNDQRTNEPLVTFLLTPDSASKFTEFMDRNSGRPLEMRVDAKVVSRPSVVAFPNGTMISGHFGEQEARDLVARFSAGTKIDIEPAAN
jgi:SecD-like export protein